MTIRRAPADVVQFTRESAERIANVVRDAELQPLPGSALTFESLPPTQSLPKVFRIATFSGAWATGSLKTVTLKHKPNTPNTLSVSNLFFPLEYLPATATRDCAVAKEGTAWFLASVPLFTATAVFITSAATSPPYTAASDIILTAFLNTTDCTITIHRTVVTSSSGIGTAVIHITGTSTARYLRLE